MPEGTLFDNSPENKEESNALETLKTLEEKISTAIDKIKNLKEEKILLERKVRELESLLNQKNSEVDRLVSEKSSIKGQIEGLLNELDGIEL